MNRSRTYRLIALVALLAVIAMPAQQANASTEQFIYGQLGDVGEWVYFYTPRTVSYSPAEIAVNKQDGPQMEMRWWNCNNINAVGFTASIPNADPAGWVWLAYNLPIPTTFCLQAKSLGNVDEGWFSAILSWDGDY